LAPFWVTKALCGAQNSLQTLRALRQGVQISQRKSSFSARQLSVHTCGFSKIWDTYSGHPLHSFPHNHIVRSVALSPSSSHLLSGGQEKKARIFDLGRPDAEPDFLCDSGPLSHDGMVKSVVWVGDHTGVTAGEDGLIK
jgi:serine-threonine kinase receptor-associated protein